MRIHYATETDDLWVELQPGAGPSEDIVVVDREYGSVHLEFNRHGQLYHVAVIGASHVISSEFLERFADKPTRL